MNHYKLSKVSGAVASLSKFVIEDFVEKKHDQATVAVNKVKEKISVIEKSRSSSFASSSSIEDGISIHPSSTASGYTYIGVEEWDALAKQVTFTEHELSLLHSLFMIFQDKGLLSFQKFWKLISYLKDENCKSLKNSSTLLAPELHFISRVDSRANCYTEENGILCELVFNLFDIHSIGSLTFNLFARV